MTKSALRSEDIPHAGALEKSVNREAYLTRSEQVGLRVEQSLTLQHFNESCSQLNVRDRFEKKHRCKLLQWRAVELSVPKMKPHLIEFLIFGHQFYFQQVETLGIERI